MAENAHDKQRLTEHEQPHTSTSSAVLCKELAGGTDAGHVNTLPNMQRRT